MKSYRIEIAVGWDESGQDIWSARGEIKGRSIPSIIRRAYYQNFNGLFDPHPVRNLIVFNAKHHNIPILRLIEI